MPRIVRCNAHDGLSPRDAPHRPPSGHHQGRRLAPLPMSLQRAWLRHGCNDQTEHHATTRGRGAAGREGAAGPAPSVPPKLPAAKQVCATWRGGWAVGREGLAEPAPQCSAGTARRTAKHRAAGLPQPGASCGQGTRRPPGWGNGLWTPAAAPGRSGYATDHPPFPWEAARGTPTMGLMRYDPSASPHVAGGGAGQGRTPSPRGSK